MILSAIDKSRLREACLLLVGKPYKLGAEVPLSSIRIGMPLPDLWEAVKEIDCSELVQVVFKYAVGENITDLAANQYVASDEIKPFFIAGRKNYNLATGDLCFLANNPKQQNNIGHVGIYIGGGIICEAKGKKYGVVLTPVGDWTKKATFAGWRRLK